MKSDQPSTRPQFVPTSNDNPRPSSITDASSLTRFLEQHPTPCASGGPLDAGGEWVPMQGEPVVGETGEDKASADYIRSIGRRLCSALGDVNHTELAKKVMGDARDRAKLETWLGLGGEGSRLSAPSQANDAQTVLGAVERWLGADDRRLLDDAWDTRRALAKGRHLKGTRSAHKGETDDRINFGGPRLEADTTRKRRESDLGKWLQTSYPAPSASDLDATSLLRLGSDVTDGSLPPYVDRSHDEEVTDRVEDALRSAPTEWQRRVVVLAGPAKSGKSRGLYEAIRRHPFTTGLEVLIPMPPVVIASAASPAPLVLDELATALDNVERARVLERQAVIFIDDLQRHFEGSAGRNVLNALERLLKRSSAPILVASINERFLYLDDSTSQGMGVSPAHREWLREHSIVCSGELDTGEVALASLRFRRQLVTGRLQDTHLRKLPAALAAVPALHQRLMHALTDPSQHLRRALTLATLDATITDPGGLTIDQLRNSTRNRHILLAPTRPSFRDPEWMDAIDWATEPVGEVWAILNREDPAGIEEEPRWRLMDALAEQLLPEHRVDEALLDRLEELQYDALVRHEYEGGDADYCMYLARRGAAKGFPSSICAIGILLEDQGGPPDEIEEQYCQALESGYSYAAYHLASFFERNGRLNDAESWYRYAEKTGDARASSGLNQMLWDQGRLEELQDRLSESSQFEDGLLLYGLGLAFAASGDLDSAEYWLQRSIDEWTSQAMTELGQVLERKGDLDGAERWYRAAIDDGDDAAITPLGILLAKDGRWTMAEGHFKQNLDFEPCYSVYLGALCERRGEFDAAETWYRKAVQEGQPLLTQELGLHALASLFEAHGAAEVARQTRVALQEMVDSRTPIDDEFDPYQHQLLAHLAGLHVLGRS